MTLNVYGEVADVPSAEWRSIEPADFPFAAHAYLHALEASGAVSDASGWTPEHLVARDDLGHVLGASPLYAKTNSYGEYIFDWSWARAYAQHGLPYYPKSLGAVPFTPATGPKLLFAATADRDAVAARLLQAAKERAVEREHSSLHYLFITPAEIPYFAANGFLIRHSFQYHWENRGYADFDAFLAAMKPKRRRQIQRERQQLAAAGLTIRILTGDELRPEHAALFHRFYLSTIDKMQAIPYLNAAFFAQVFASMRDNVVLMLAEAHGEAVAAALYYHKGDSLYGRYWGATAEVRNLHFELCYYQPIAWAIARGLKRFEAGAQGEHKLARGLLPVLTYSAHWLRHPAFSRAVADFIAAEKTGLAQMFAELEAHSPFRSDV